MSLRRAVFLDRDGVINETVFNEREGLPDSPSNSEEFVLVGGAGEAIKRIKEQGWLVIVVSNQPGIAKNKMTGDQLEAINRKMREELQLRGAHLDALYYCLHHPQAVNAKYRLECGCRKPKAGLLLQAARDHEIELMNSYMVGDSARDVAAGKAAGCRTVLITNEPLGTTQTLSEEMPDLIAEDLLAAVKLIEKMEAAHANLRG